MQVAAEAALDVLIAGKPQQHSFNIAAGRLAVERHMYVTEG